MATPNYLALVPQDARVLHLPSNKKGKAGWDYTAIAVPRDGFIIIGNYGIVLDGLFLLVDFDREDPRRDEWIDALPPTWMQTTPHGEHRLYRVPATWRGKNTKISSAKDNKTPIGDVKVHGYFVGPGSRYERCPNHPDGCSRKQDNYICTDDRDPVDAPEWLLKICERQEQPEPGAPSVEREMMRDGERDNELASIAGFFRHLGYGERGITLALRGINTCGIVEQPPGREITEHDIHRIAHSIANYPPGDGGGWFNEGEVDMGDEGASNSRRRTPYDVLTFDGLARRCNEGEHANWLIEGLLRRSGLLLLCARPKVGKSTMGANLAKAVASGNPFLTRRCQRGKVLWIGLEEPLQDLHERAEILQMQDLAVIYVVDRPVGDKGKWLRAMVERHRPDLVIIDTIGRFADLQEIDSYSDVTRATQPMLDVRNRFGTTFVLLHHNNKADATLGSTQWEAVVDTIMTLTRSPDGARFVRTKQRSGIDMEPTVLTLDHDNGEITCAESAALADQRVAERAILVYLATVADATREDLARRSGRKLSIGRAAVDALITAGLLTMRGSGTKGDPRRYALSASDSSDSSDTSFCIGHSSGKRRDEESANSSDTSDSSSYYTPDEETRNFRAAESVAPDSSSEVTRTRARVAEGSEHGDPGRNPSSDPAHPHPRERSAKPGIPARRTWRVLPADEDVPTDEIRGNA